MLTGDNAQTARVIANEAGIADARGDLLPQAKQSAIQDLQRAHGVTDMIGDGINDAPSQAQADIGFAMGGAGTSWDITEMIEGATRAPSTRRSPYAPSWRPRSGGGWLDTSLRHRFDASASVSTKS